MAYRAKFSSETNELKKVFLSSEKMTVPSSVDTWNQCLNKPLEQEDPEMFHLIEAEKQRQYSGLELIASEVTLKLLTSSYKCPRRISRLLL
jgi:hypothetical protein